MSDQLHPFSHLPSIEPPPTLLSGVLKAVERARLRRLRLRAFIVSFGFLSCLAYVAIYGFAFQEELASSSFFSLLRLAFSDPDIVFAHGKEFALGLLEGLPVGTLLFSSIGLFLFLGAAASVGSLRRAQISPLPTHLST